MSGQPSPYSEGDVAKWQDLAEQRGHLLRDMTDKWAEARVRFVERQRSQSAKITELQIRERSLTWRIREVERVLMIVQQLIEKIEPEEVQASIARHIKQTMPEAGVDSIGGVIVQLRQLREMQWTGVITVSFDQDGKVRLTNVDEVTG